MKAIHKKNEMPPTTDSELARAKKLELDGELDKAASAFEKVIKGEPLNEYAYNRLMIIYRKNKDYASELAAINKGIGAFEKSFQSSSSVTVTKKIASLSKSLLKSLGLADKKGNSLYKREPLGRWSKRKLVVERLVRKANKGRRK